MTATEMATLAVAALKDKLAKDIHVIDIDAISTLGNYLIVCEAGSTTQAKALCDSVEYHLNKKEIHPLRIEGYQGGNWILADYGEVMVHVFTGNKHQFYNLENLWADGTEVDLPDLEL